MNTGERHNAAQWLVDRHVEEGRGSLVAVKADGAETTYDGLQSEVFRAQNALVQLGVQPGDRLRSNARVASLVVDDLPKTATGKIKRYELRQTLGS